MQRHSLQILQTLVFCAAGLLMVACGNKGELYLKDDPNITGSDGSVDALINDVRGEAGTSTNSTVPPAPGADTVELTEDAELSDGDDTTGSTDGADDETR